MRALSYFGQGTRFGDTEAEALCRRAGDAREGGRLRALAVSTSKRSAAAPEVPTIAEGGAALECASAGALMTGPEAV